MYELGYDLKVDDEGFVSESEFLFGKAQEFELQLGILVEIMKQVTETAIMEGKTAENLVLYLEELSSLQTEAGELASTLRTMVGNYVASIDEADSYVY